MHKYVSSPYAETTHTLNTISIVSHTLTLWHYLRLRLMCLHSQQPAVCEHVDYPACVWAWTMTCLNGLNTPYIIQRSRREKSSLALCCLLARIRNITVNVSVFFFFKAVFSFCRVWDWNYGCCDKDFSPAILIWENICRYESGFMFSYIIQSDIGQ